MSVEKTPEGFRSRRSENLESVKSDKVTASKMPGIPVVSSSPSSLKGRVSLGDPMSQTVNFKVEGFETQKFEGYLKNNASEKRRGPDLILPSDTTRTERIKKVYRTEVTETKAAFRKAVVEQLKSEWSKVHPKEKVEALTKTFYSLASQVEKDGLAAINNIISKNDFSKFITKYTELMDAHGNKTWLHSFADLRRHPEFLMDSEHNQGFFHPLLVSLIAYEMGGPVRVNDARAKDADPMVAVTLDNMLHIDNVPFTREFKVTQFWKKGEVKGPDGQCFVCLPGTNTTPRAPDGMIVDGKPIPFDELDADQATADEGAVLYTTEAGSVFRTNEELEGALKAQREAKGIDKPQVVGLRGNEVFTAVAETGNMVHHRYRVPGGNPRSCLLIAYHLIDDDNGKLVTKQRLKEAKTKSGGSDLVEFILGGFPEKKAKRDEAFVKALNGSVAAQAAELLEHFAVDEPLEEAPKLCSPEALAFNEAEVQAWKDSVLHGPGTTAKKEEAKIIAYGDTMKRKEFIQKVKSLMSYDKSGVLELILYSDGREEKRKWARNQIRELRLDQQDVKLPEGSPPTLDTRLKDWEPFITQPNQNDILTKSELADAARELETLAKQMIDSGVTPTDELNPKTGKEYILPSVHQLIGDLAIAIEHCSNTECFVSTGLFIFWAADTLKRVLPEDHVDSKISEVGGKVLKHYVSLVAALETQKNAA